MKLTYANKEYNVSLASKFGEYNCGHKTCGRLSLVVKDSSGKVVTTLGAGTFKSQLDTPAVRDGIISEFLATIDNNGCGMYGQLKSNSPFFPTDTGTYRPGTLFYADRIDDKGLEWYNNWKALLPHLERNKAFGCKVWKSPILVNRFYGVGSPSRIWLVFLPGVAKYMKDDFSPTAEVVTGAKSTAAYSCSPELQQEIQKLTA